MPPDEDPLAHLFALLDQWRHFPAYQLERRADVFFAVEEQLGKDERLSTAAG